MTIKSKTIEYINVIARSLLSVSVMAQPWPGIQTAFKRTPIIKKIRMKGENKTGRFHIIPCNKRDQWPRMIMTSGTTIYHRRAQTAMLKHWLLNEYIRNSFNWRTFEGKDWCSRDQRQNFLSTGSQLYEQENEEKVHTYILYLIESVERLTVYLPDLIRYWEH